MGPIWEMMTYRANAPSKYQNHCVNLVSSSRNIVPDAHFMSGHSPFQRLGALRAFFANADSVVVPPS